MKKKHKDYKDLDRGDGVCKFLNENLCSIYEQRPLLCRVDESWEKIFSSKMSREDFYELNLKDFNALVNKYM
jgi:Fe-S-cluster containining protein